VAKFAIAEGVDFGGRCHSKAAMDPVVSWSR